MQPVINLTNSLSEILILLSVVTFFFIPEANAQIDSSSVSFRELAKADSLLFEEGFNSCNLAALEDLIHSDFEFYHDVAGLQSRAGFFRSVKENICSTPEHKPTRKLIPGSLEVFLLKDYGEIYGAIQKGEHQFYIKEPDKELYLTGTARFTHVWILENDNWKLKRVLSYNH